MLTVAEAFDKFRGKISTPTEKETKDASRRQREIRAVMDREFHVQRDFLSGSYARWTKTKPLKDVDVFCVLGGEDQKYRNQDPSVILNEVARIMGDQYGKDNITIQTRSVGIAFKSASDEEVMSFDVVTAFDAGEHYEVPDTKSKDKWTKTDPEVHKELARDKHAGLAPRSSLSESPSKGTRCYRICFPRKEHTPSAEFDLRNLSGALLTPPKALSYTQQSKPGWVLSNHF